MPSWRMPGRPVMLRFHACDTSWLIHATGRRAGRAAARAQARVRELEARLNAFDPRSAVAALHRDGRVVDAHVARLVERGEEYRGRTAGAFDVRHGDLEHRIKDYLRGRTDETPTDAGAARLRVEGDLVVAQGMVDLNGIAKGYIVDEARATLAAEGAADGFVDGGGDIATPTGPVAIESPYGGARLALLDTRWNVATSGNARRRRGTVDHIYDPREGRVGARHDQVTVVARRDCVEADVLATTLAALPTDEGQRLVKGWPGVEALWVDHGKTTASRGFEDHVWKP